MKARWFDEYHPVCDDCYETSTDERDSLHAPWWKRRIRMCNERVVDFNLMLMSGGPGKNSVLVRLCTSSFHGGYAHVHSYMSDTPSRASTSTLCTPRWLDNALLRADMLISDHDEYETMNWKVETWARKWESS